MLLNHVPVCGISSIAQWFATHLTDARMKTRMRTLKMMDDMFLFPNDENESDEDDDGEI